jgi:phenylacetate-CoA ligase
MAMTRVRPEPGDWSSWEELGALQRTALDRLWAWAASSPFYAARGVDRTLSALADRFAALPTTSKADLRAAYPFGMLAVPRSALATYHESSGTAGTPTPSYYTEEDWGDLTERYARKWVPIGPEDTFLVRTPYALMVTGHLAHAAARAKGATVVPGDNRSLAMPYSRVVRVLHTLGVTLTWSMATETLMWAAAARLAGLDPATDFPALRAVFVGGDALSDRRRRRIQEIWRVPVVEEYGSTETGSLAGACQQGRLHLWADRAIFEVFDPGTETLRPDGTGQLVVTPLYRQAMPLLRYNLEDDVQVSYDPCPCGTLLPTVRVFGRSAFTHQVNGRSVTQDVLDDAVFSLPIDAGVLFWRARAATDRLDIQVEAGDGWAATVREQLAELVRQRTGVEPSVEAVPAGTLVPTDVLTATRDVVKPRSLFGGAEDWSKAITYY